jgi:hypothetical protein
MEYDSNNWQPRSQAELSKRSLKNFSKCGQTARLRTGVIFRINKRRSMLDGRLTLRDPLTQLRRDWKNQ